MPKLRRLNGNEVIKILAEFGFEVIRIRGSHHRLERIVDEQSQLVTVPVHDYFEEYLSRRL
jgi:predicted RNA binding protein YcfA (HicA-like mRNA interferase family)